MRPATPDEIARWDELVAANPDGGSVLQLKAFGETKSRHGWKPQYLMADNVAVLFLSRKIPVLGEFWYVPNGPGVTDLSGVERFTEMVKGVRPQPFMVKIDPPILKPEIELKDLHELGFVRAPRDIQYNISTVIVNLEPDEEQILSSFKQKTRYNIRLAAKHGVVAEAVETTADTIDHFYSLARSTYKRAGVYVRSKSYFADYWRLHSESGHGQMFFARHNDELLAGAYIPFVGNKALYKDGASSRRRTDVQAPYALQWGIMRWLKARGVKSYDLHGVPPANRIDDQTHPLAGLARFKTGFQPEVTEFAGTFDLPLDAEAYSRWVSYGERFAVAFESRVRRRLFY